MRFFYEFFLEFCICAILQLTIIEKFNEFWPTLWYVIAAGVCLAILALIAFVLSLFVHGGPWISGFYNRSTALKSSGYGRNRTRDPDFNGKAWLRDNPAPMIEPKGTYLISFDCGKKKEVLDLRKLYQADEQKDSKKEDLP